MEVVILVVILLFIAFFSGTEIAFLTANKLRVELLKEKGDSQAKIISDFNQNPAQFISTLLIGLNIALVVFGSMMAKIITPDRFSFLPEKGFALLITETIITTVLVLFLGELIPKLLFRINADSILLSLSYPLKYLIYIPLKPLSLLFHWLSKLILTKFIGKDFVEHSPTFSQEDLEYLIKETASEVTNEEDTDDLNSELFEKALYLKETKLKSCMVPRMEIVAIEASDILANLRKIILDTKHSRILVYEKTIDNIVGYVYHLDLLKTPLSIKEIIRPIIIVPSSMNAQDLLIQFRKERKNIAWVIDEYGGTAGVVTLEDLIEEIFGEIEDEHDVEDLIEKKINDSEFVFSGRLEVSYLNEEYDLEIPEGEYSTLAGYIVVNNEDIPNQNEVVFVDQFEIRILKASNKRIDLVRLRVVNREGV